MLRCIYLNTQISNNFWRILVKTKQNLTAASLKWRWYVKSTIRFLTNYSKFKLGNGFSESEDGPQKY